MTKIAFLTSALVGGHFRPPAKQVLTALPSGTTLALIPEPENPYDPHALKACLFIAGVDKMSWPEIEAALEGTGTTLDELLEAEEPLQLGFVAASGGKPLAKAGLTDGNQEFLTAMAAWPEHVAKLAFAADGNPRVLLLEQEPKTVGVIPEPTGFQESQDER